MNQRVLQELSYWTKIIKNKSKTMVSTGYGKDLNRDLQRDIRCFEGKTWRLRGDHPRRRRVSLGHFIADDTIQGEAPGNHKQFNDSTLSHNWRRTVETDFAKKIEYFYSKTRANVASPGNMHALIWLNLKELWTLCGSLSAYAARSDGSSKLI